ncbi:hypothetical protein ACHAXR_009918 [Thalassiosira sp. AJA248-18]
MTRLIFIFVWASLFVLSCSTIGVVDASDGDIDCPGPDDAFVTSCSGSEASPPDPNDSPSAETETESFDDADLVNEVLEDSKEDEHNTASTSKNNGGKQHDINNDSGEEAGFCDATEEEGGAAMQQLKYTTKRLIQQYYDPLPKQGKCVIGTVCGFTASRLSLGVANRIVRLAGATWVLSEIYSPRCSLRSYIFLYIFDMIIDAKTVIITFSIIGAATYFGLGAIRSFALSIAQENHDANLALDMTEEARRAKRERDADAAATAAFSKVEPLLPASVVAKGASLPLGQESSAIAIKAASTALPKSAPSSGNALNIDIGAVINEGDEEAPKDGTSNMTADI